MQLPKMLSGLGRYLQPLGTSQDHRSLHQRIDQQRVPGSNDLVITAWTGALITRGPKLFSNARQSELIIVTAQLQGRGAMLESAARCHGEHLGCPGCVVLPQRGPQLITVPDVVGTLSKLTMIIF